mmetsp:Transcript_10236/g.31767  ORF Transcript_10236/g.31767 Transcript_10236/m.31767 type:complete len:233 (-) Transcript_10236:107-805(-)
MGLELISAQFISCMRCSIQTAEPSGRSFKISLALRTAICPTSCSFSLARKMWAATLPSFCRPAFRSHPVGFSTSFAHWRKSLTIARPSSRPSKVYIASKSSSLMGAMSSPLAFRASSIRSASPRSAPSAPPRRVPSASGAEVSPPQATSASASASASAGTSPLGSGSSAWAFWMNFAASMTQLLGSSTPGASSTRPASNSSATSLPSSTSGRATAPNRRGMASSTLSLSHWT